MAGLLFVYALEGDLFKGEPQAMIYDVDGKNIVTGEGFFAQTFTDVAGMTQDADVIARVKVINQETRPAYEVGTVHTRSELEVVKVMKGNVDSGDVIPLLETGGKYDEREGAKYISSKKPGSGKAKGMITRGIEGVVPIEKGNEYIVFLNLNEGDAERNYHLVGSIQGKIKVKDNLLVSHLSPEAIKHGEKHDDLHFLPEKYAGKPVSELETVIKSALK